MPNTYTDLVNDTYAALNVVSRENADFVANVTRDSSLDRTPLGATFRIPVGPAISGQDRVVGMALPAAAYTATSNNNGTITNDREFPFSWTGGDQRNLDSGPGHLTIQQNNIAEAMRAAINEMDATVSAVARKGASRAYGTAGTTPFASSLADSAQVKKILDANGAPKTNRILAVSGDSAVNILSLTQLTKVNEGGTSAVQRDGQLINLHGFKFIESANLSTVTKGTGASYVLDGAHAIGATTITLKTGSGTVLAGDFLTIGSHKYGVKTGLAAAGALTINAPGLLAAGSDGATVTVGNNFTPNVAYARSAIVLATRLPDMPAEGDMATMSEIITDPLTGISFELRCYPGKGMVTYCLAACWGAAVIKPEHVAVLLG